MPIAILEFGFDFLCMCVCVFSSADFSERENATVKLICS